MIKTFKGQGTEDLFNGVDTKVARRTCDQRVWPTAKRRLDLLDAAKDLRDLRGTGLSLESLKHDKPGFHAIRISDKYRIVFRMEHGDVYEVEVTDYH